MEFRCASWQLALKANFEMWFIQERSSLIVNNNLLNKAIKVFVTRKETTENRSVIDCTMNCRNRILCALAARVT